MRNVRTSLAVLLLSAIAFAGMARADYTTRDGNGNIINIKSFVVGNGVNPQATPVDQFGNAYNVANPLPTAAGSSTLAGMVSVSATSTSSNIALPQLSTSYPTITLYNAGPKDVFFAQGTASVTASTASTRIPAGVPITVAVTGPYVAAVTAGSDTATLLIYQATGPIYFGAGAAAGGGGSSTTFGTTFPTTGSAIGMSQGGNLIALTGTAGNLNVQCSNCTGSGVSAADGAAFSAGASLFAPGGGFYQTTATSNPLTTGQQGLFQMTAQRALFTNIRNASGAELGVAAAPFQVSLANTAANGTPVVVSGTGSINTAPPNTASYLGALMSGQTGGLMKGVIVCDQHLYKHITSATDTFAVQGVSGQTIYVCGWRSRAAGTATWFLENTASTNANCAGALTQINGLATEIANSGDVTYAPIWGGMKNTAGNGLCINSTGSGGFDLDVWYAQL